MTKSPLVIVVFLFVTLFCYAQAPQGFHYQAVARDRVGGLLKNQPITIKISILSGEIKTAVYTELHRIVTSDLGLMQLEIGSGTPLNGFFDKINWHEGAKWIDLAIDQNNNGHFVAVGISRLFSVPYALYARQAQFVSENTFDRSLADSVWLLTGNPGTNAMNNYIGTRDFADLIFKANNTERLRIKAAGQIGIGSSSPSSSLEVVGDARFGDGANYAYFSAGGDLSFKSGADYLVGPNRFAFRYLLNENYGLRFSATSRQYEFTTLDGSGVVTISADNGKTYIRGRLGLGTPNPVAKLDVRGNAYFGDGATNFAQFTTGGDLFFSGNADYQVAPNSYAFRYGPNQNIGLYYNSDKAQYELKDVTAAPAFSVKAFTGNAFIAGKLGIGITNPAEQLEVTGAIKLGNTANANEGTIRWTGTDFEGHNGLQWQSLTDGGMGEDTTNELQDLLISGNMLALTNSSTTIDLSPYLDNTDAQTLSVAGNTITISNGNSITLSGANGPTGATGATGPTGANGTQGLQGQAGPMGPQGLQGIQGPIGPVGLMGPTGLTGATGPTGPAGVNGQQGAQGIQGVPGPQGIQGIRGPTGQQGSVGTIGVQGITGPTGTQGIQGTTGPVGATGPTGLDGLPGATGSDGAVGATGPTGQTGAAGPAGANGANGSQGLRGLTGLQGPAGPQGSQGSAGARGPQGIQGVQGPAGPLVSGAVNQTLRHSGSSWVASSTLYNRHSSVELNLSGLTTKFYQIVIDRRGVGSQGNEPTIRPRDTYYGFLGTSDKLWYRVYTNNIYRTNEYSISDKRLKLNIRPLKSSLDKVLSLNGYRYDFDLNKHPYLKDVELKESDKDLHKNNIGFMAQELKEVFPELVVYDEEIGYYTIKNVEQLIPVIIEAIKEQQSEKDLLEKQVNLLQRKVELLEQLISQK